MSISLAEARERIDAILRGYRDALDDAVQSPLPPALTAGKVYEAWVLLDVLRRLRDHEGYTPKLINAEEVRLKTSPGVIDRDDPHFLLTASGREPLEVWTDVEFLSLSAGVRGVSQPLAERCDYHELDIVVVPAGTRGRPAAEHVRIGVECKNVTYRKELLRAILGVRRELSYLTDPQTTRFRRWPHTTVNAMPPSCLLAYGSDPRIGDFAPPGEVFSIDFVHEPLP